MPKFGLFINLVGAFSCTALAFIMPVLMYNQTHRESVVGTRRYGHYALLFFGTSCGLISFILSIKEIAGAFSADRDNLNVLG